MSNQPKEFNKFQQAVFPIHMYELKKFLPMSFLMFSILFVYTMVRDLKDVFVQNKVVSGGVELVSSLKLFFVMPAAFLAVMAFTVLVNKFGAEKTFYIIISFFGAFFALFAFIIYPNIDAMQMNAEQVKAWQASAPSFLYYIIPCLGSWAYTTFYIFSEIWGSMAISSLFWQFANKTTMKTEVKRFFGLFSIIGNIGVAFSASAIKVAAKAKDAADFNRNVQILISIAVVFCIITMAIYYYINNVVLKDPRFYDPAQIKPKKKKEKVSIMEGIKILFKTPYLLLISLLVIGYGMGLNIFEMVWKSEMKTYLPDPAQYANMMGNLSLTTSVATILITILGSNVLRRCKWKTSAAVTPLAFMLLGLPIFALVIFRVVGGGSQIFGVSVLFLAVTIGLVVDALLKSVKYSLFDSTKSMAYIPLDEDTKTKGQAAVEVIGGRAGKAGGAALWYVLLNLVSAGSKITNHLVTAAAVFAIVVGAWVVSVFNLSSKYEKAVAEREAEEAEVKQEKVEA